MDIYEKIRVGEYTNTTPYTTPGIKGTSKEAIAAQHHAYNEEDQRLYLEFKKDLLEYLGLTNHPKAEKLFSMAWGDGHASGYEEVAICADRYAELLRD